MNFFKEYPNLITESHSVAKLRQVEAEGDETFASAVDRLTNDTSVSLEEKRIFLNNKQKTDYWRTAEDQSVKIAYAELRAEELFPEQL